MDMRDASAMTEASGLTNEQGGIEQTSGRRPDSAPERGGRPSFSSSTSTLAMQWIDQLREVTVKAPLRSLFVAFLVGAWFGRRR